jgi:hypothetical protein
MTQRLFQRAFSPVNPMMSMNQDPHGRIVLWLSARRTALPIGYEIQTFSGLFSKRKTDQPILFNWRIFGSQPNGQAASYLAWRNYEG